MENECIVESSYEDDQTNTWVDYNKVDKLMDKLRNKIESPEIKLDNVNRKEEEKKKSTEPNYNYRKKPANHESNWRKIWDDVEETKEKKRLNYEECINLSYGTRIFSEVKRTRYMITYTKSWLWVKPITLDWKPLSQKSSKLPDSDINNNFYSICAKQNA